MKFINSLLLVCVCNLFTISVSAAEKCDVEALLQKITKIGYKVKERETYTMSGQKVNVYFFEKQTGSGILSAMLGISEFLSNDVAKIIYQEEINDNPEYAENAFLYERYVSVILSPSIIDISKFHDIVENNEASKLIGDVWNKAYQNIPEYDQKADLQKVKKILKECKNIDLSGFFSPSHKKIINRNLNEEKIMLEDFLMTSEKSEENLLGTSFKVVEGYQLQNMTAKNYKIVTVIVGVYQEEKLVTLEREYLYNSAKGSKLEIKNSYQGLFSDVDSSKRADKVILAVFAY